MNGSHPFAVFKTSNSLYYDRQYEPSIVEVSDEAAFLTYVRENEIVAVINLSQTAAGKYLQHIVLVLLFPYAYALGAGLLIFLLGLEQSSRLSKLSLSRFVMICLSFKSATLSC
jgi:hypothetical protein